MKMLKHRSAPSKSSYIADWLNWPDLLLGWFCLVCFVNTSDLQLFFLWNCSWDGTKYMEKMFCFCFFSGWAFHEHIFPTISPRGTACGIILRGFAGFVVQPSMSQGSSVSVFWITTGSGLDLPKNPQERPILGSKLGRCNLDTTYHNVAYSTLLKEWSVPQQILPHINLSSWIVRNEALRLCCCCKKSHSSHRVRKIMPQLVVVYKVRKSLAIPSPPSKL